MNLALETKENKMPSLLDTYVADNYKKHVISQSGVGRELIVKIVSDNDITDAELNAMIEYITLSHGVDGDGDSAFTIGGLGTADGTAFESGTTDTVFLRCQGTGDLTVADVKTAGDDQSTDDGTGNTYTVSIEAVFVPAK